MEEELTLLEEAGIFIHLDYEHYDNGTNCLFQIEFRDKKTKTCQFGDNHEFGNTVDTIQAAIDLAWWYHNDKSRIDMINSGYHNDGYAQYKEDLWAFLRQYYTNEYLKIINKYDK